MPDAAFYNGHYTTLQQLRVSPEDRAFYFGDGVYEVIKALEGTFFALDLHLDRLYRSAAGIELRIPWSREELIGILTRLLDQSAYRDALIYVQISRGLAARSHAYPAPETPPSLCAWVKVFDSLPEAMYEKGAKAVTMPDQRWPNAWIKSINLLPNAMAANAAKRAGAFEAIFVDRDGYVNECSLSNLFAVLEGVVRTAPKGRNILWGISRHVTLQCAQALGLPVEERAFSVPEMYCADEVFLTSTSPDVLPIVNIDGHPIAGGKPGPITGKLLAAFRNYIKTGEYAVDV